MKIITVGISPGWDVVCRGERVDWGQHRVVQQKRIAAGKALNVSRALAWMSKQSTAAGLWGEDDFSEMSAALKPHSGLVNVCFTKVPGRTRENITVVDKTSGREMHLRAESRLASIESLGKLEKDLCGMIGDGSICIFAGSMPDSNLLDGVISVIEAAKDCGAKIVVDTSGAALDRIVDLGGIEILKPNLGELSELLGVNVKDDPAEIAQAAKSLLNKAKTIVVTRGEKGAVVVTKDRVLQGRCTTKNKTVTTVGCGDYFLAGFLSGKSLEDSLARGLKAAAARAWSDNSSWNEIEKKIDIEIL